MGRVRSLCHAGPMWSRKLSPVQTSVEKFYQGDVVSQRRERSTPGGHRRLRTAQHHPTAAIPSVSESPVDESGARS